MAKSDTQIRSLFDSVESKPKSEDSRPITSIQFARNFVKWCCSFGEEFRNSPDEGNLRSWAGNEDFPYKSTQEKQILQFAQEIYLKRIVGSLQKSHGRNGSPDPPLVN